MIQKVNLKENVNAFDDLFHYKRVNEYNSVNLQKIKEEIL